MANVPATKACPIKCMHVSYIDPNVKQTDLRANFGGVKTILVRKGLKKTSTKPIKPFKVQQNALRNVQLS